jgi:hypothetical protein
MLATGSLRDALADGFIKIYGGTAPAAADDAISGSNPLLNTVSLDGAGGGINLDVVAVGGIIGKSPSDDWFGINAASGTATFYRHVAAGDTGALSTTAPRLQGTIATAGADLNLSDVALVSGADQRIDYYVVNLPTL